MPFDGTPDRIGVGDDLQVRTYAIHHSPSALVLQYALNSDLFELPETTGRAGAGTWCVLITGSEQWSRFLQSNGEKQGAGLIAYGRPPVLGEVGHRVIDYFQQL